MDPLADLDLNLLRTLEVLLHERSVTRTAELVGRSQPAVSHALQRLREALDDPLLVREGRAMVPTPRAEALAPELTATLASLRRLVRSEASFDPTTARRTFSLSCPDVLAPLVSEILRALGDAPGVGLELRTGDPDLVDTTADVALGLLPEAAPGVIARPLGILRPCVVMRAGHPALRQPWTAQTFARWSHVLVRTLRPGASAVERTLKGAGLERRVGLVVPNFLLAVHAVARSDLFFTTSRALLTPLAAPLGLHLLDPPLPMPSVRVAALWSERMQADPGHRWFREHVIQAALAAIGGDAPR